MGSVDLTTVAGLAAATAIIVQLILTAAAPSDAASSRWGPILALGVAVGLSVLNTGATSAALTTQQLWSAVLLGLTAGGVAMGTHNVVTKSVLGATVTASLGIGGGGDPPPADPTPAAAP